LVDSLGAGELISCLIMTERSHCHPYSQNESVQSPARSPKLFHCDCYFWG